MRLIRVSALPGWLQSWGRWQWIHGLCCVVVAVTLWLPSPSAAVMLLPVLAALVWGQLLLQSGVYLGASLAREQTSLVPFAGLMLALVLIAMVLPLMGVFVLAGLALALLTLLEKTDLVGSAWPQAWLDSRRQHAKLIWVALALTVFWLLSEDNQRLLAQPGVS